MRTSLLLTLAAVTVLTACRAPAADTAGLRDAVEAQAQAQESMRSRLAELDQQVSSLLSIDAASQLRTLGVAVDDVATEVASIRTDLDDGLRTASEDRTDLRGDLSAVSASLDDLTSTVNALRASLELLDEDLGSLETQFRTHRDDPDAHN